MENEEHKEPSVENVKLKPDNPENTQVYNIVTGRDPSWQSIIYELISSEQLDPWNIDLGVLCRSYFEKIQKLEESNFQVSSKILLAAALLLRIKSEILLTRYIREIDNVLFKREDELKKIIERIEIDENDVPVLSPKTPLPRFKKVTLQELIDALDTAIKTESRRINKEIEKKQAERLSYVDIPKFKRINIKDRIRHLYARILTSFKNPQHKDSIKLPYSHFTGDSKEEKIACFLPMLYLSNHGRLWLEQESHFSEIYLYLYDTFKKSFPDYDKTLIDSEEKLEEIPEHMMHKVVDEFKDAMDAAENDLDETEKQKRVEKINKDFENPIGDLINSSEESEK